LWWWLFGFSFIEMTMCQLAEFLTLADMGCFKWHGGYHQKNIRNHCGCCCCPQRRFFFVP
jgi:hypothetical protein